MKKLRSLVVHLNIIGFIPSLLIYLFITSCSEKKAPEPTLENSDYSGVPRIVILSNSISTSTVSGFSEPGASCEFSVRAQSKDGILLMKIDLLDYNNKVISSSSSYNSNLATNNQQNFSNINITDYTGTYSVYIPYDIKDSVMAKATLIDKLEHEEFAYFTIYLKKSPFNIYFSDSSVPEDSITTAKYVNAGSLISFYIMAKSDKEPVNITYLFYKKSTKVSIDGFPKKSTFSNSNSSSNGYYSSYFSIATPDTGIYIFKAFSYTQNGSADTTEIILYSKPPVLYSNTSNIGAQYNTLLGISYNLGSYYSSYYKNLTQTSKSAFSYVYDNSTPYLISLFERKNANIYGDSLPLNTQHTRFIELSLPVSVYDTISGNYIFSLIIPETTPEKISISTSKLIGYEDSDQNKGVLKINSIEVGSTGSINFDNKYQFKLGTQ